MTLGRYGVVGEGKYQYFSGYCRHCGQKNYLARDEAQQFVNEVYCSRYSLAKIILGKIKIKIPRIRIEWQARENIIGQVVAVPAHVPQKQEKHINLDSFDSKYSNVGGVGWLKENRAAKLKQIAGHYGFSMEYARRVRNEV